MIGRIGVDVEFDLVNWRGFLNRAFAPQRAAALSLPFLLILHFSLHNLSQIRLPILGLPILNLPILGLPPPLPKPPLPKPLPKPPLGPLDPAPKPAARPPALPLPGGLHGVVLDSFVELDYFGVGGVPVLLEHALPRPVLLLLLLSLLFGRLFRALLGLGAGAGAGVGGLSFLGLFFLFIFLDFTSIGLLNRALNPTDLLLFYLVPQKLKVIISLSSQRPRIRSLSLFFDAFKII